MLNIIKFIAGFTILPISLAIVFAITYFGGEKGAYLLVLIVLLGGSIAIGYAFRKYA